MNTENHWRAMRDDGGVIEIFDADFAAEPWPVLDRLRDEGGVHRVRTPDGPPAWLATRYDDVRAGLLDDRLSSHIRRYAGGRDYQGFVLPPQLDVNLNNAEPADQARVRRLVTGELSPRRLAEWTRRAPELVETCLRTMKSGDEIDIVEHLAVPLPATVIGELLGLAGPERELLRSWADATLLSHEDTAAPRARDTLTTMLTLITTTIQREQQARTDTVLGRLVAAHHTDGTLSADELAGLLFYLLFVWYEVLTDLIAGSLLTLLTQPDQLDLFRELRDKHSAVDELLRYLSPQVLAGPRVATTDLPLGEHTVRAGETVLLCLAGANHDPEIFDKPGELELTRQPNAQLGLGYGTHACLGTALVRTLSAAALEQVLDRWPGATVPDREIAWRSGFRHRGPQTLVVRLE